MTPGAIVRWKRSTYVFVRSGCASGMGAACPHPDPVTLRRTDHPDAPAWTVCAPAGELAKGQQP